MKNNIKRKLTILIIIPFVVSYLIHLLLSIGVRMDSSIILSVINTVIYLWAFTAIFFWFYVGKQFGKLDISKVKSFILGNSLWMSSLALYIWQFTLLNDEKRNFFIAGISQSYNLGFVFISSRIISLFTNNLDTKTVTIFSYLFMLIVFAIGFLYTSKNSIKKVDI